MVGKKSFSTFIISNVVFKPKVKGRIVYISNHALLRILHVIENTAQKTDSQFVHEVKQQIESNN
jgi:hypothetical protein